MVLFALGLHVGADDTVDAGVAAGVIVDTVHRKKQKCISWRVSAPPNKGYQGMIGFSKKAAKIGSPPRLKSHALTMTPAASD